MSPQSRLSLERKVDELQADLTQAHDRLRELSALLADAGIPGGTTLYGGVLILRERAEKAEAALEQATRHDCERWASEGMGCAQCNPSAIACREVWKDDPVRKERDALVLKLEQATKERDANYLVPREIVQDLKHTYIVRGLGKDYRTVSLDCLNCHGVYPYHRPDCDPQKAFKTLLEAAESWKERAEKAEAALAQVQGERDEALRRLYEVVPPPIEIGGWVGGIAGRRVPAPSGCPVCGEFIGHGHSCAGGESLSNLPKPTTTEREEP